jgi:microcin C transport system permease protein
MGAYILRRLLLIVPTLFGILLINFLLVQFMPGGPVEQVLAELQQDTGALDRISGGGGGGASAVGGGSSEYRGAQGLPPEFIAELEMQFGFDKPPATRFVFML